MVDVIEIGDCRDIMQRWITDGVRVQMCVTSPPYWGLRDYGVAEQIGLAEASVVNQQLTTEAEPVAWSEEVMRQWDGVRKAIAKGDTSSWPRDWFESLAPPPRRELERELAAVTAERDALRSALNPRGWTRAQSDAWHRALLGPVDIRFAFADNAGIQRPASAGPLE